MTFVRVVVVCAFACLMRPAPAIADAPLPALVPKPAVAAPIACASGPMRLNRPLRFPSAVDAGGFDLIRERWRALGIPAPVRGARPDVDVRPVRTARSPILGAYRLKVAPTGIELSANDGDAQFNGLATLAQLPVRRDGTWVLPCVAIADAPAMRWRIVSDDISRGPFPTMAYFRDRIRTLASLKINGWSPYMEQVFADPGHPYVAFPNALRAADLRALTVYARRFHVALIPEQQTFAHMHETLKYEQLADLAEFPHGYLVAQRAPATYAYLEPLLRAELAAVGRTPFFHVGADEPLDLGRGSTPRTAAVFADHVARVAAVVALNGARPMIWDDAIQRDPTILALLSKHTVIVSFHYGAETSFAPYLKLVADAGFDQMVSPGANNWDEIYADLDTAYANEAQFIADGQAAHVFGMFETVWHDDGESLFEAAWAPVAFAAASAWQATPVDRATWHATFARAFFGSDDPRYASDLDALAAMRTDLRTKPASDPPNYLFWADPFDPRIGARMATVDLAGLRRHAEDVMAHLASAQPPLHAQAARVMRLAALRYDTLGRRYQIGQEARAAYEDARAHAPAHTDAIVYRSLNIAKYLCWEMRDEMTALAPLYAQAWDDESTPAGKNRVLVRYQLAAQEAVTYADRLNAAAREDYLRGGVLPPFESVMGLPK